MARAAINPETGLTDQQESFAYWLVRLGRQNQAYRKAYDAKEMSDPAVSVEACRLAADPKIALRIKHYRDIALAKLDASIERIALELGRIAFFDARDLFDDDGNPIPISELPEDVARVISGVDVEDLWEKNEEGRREKVGVVRKYRLSNKQPALETLAKWKRMLVEQVEHGKPGQFKDKEELKKSIKGRMVRLGLAKVADIKDARKTRA